MPRAKRPGHMPSIQPRARLWSFTRNKRDDEQSLPAPWSELPTGATWLFFQQEKAARPHYQGVVHFKNPLRRSGVAALLGGGGIHLEISRGSAEDNKTYCSKQATREEGTDPWELGQMPQQGKRTDVDSAVETIREEGYTAAAINHPTVFIKYPNGMKEYASVIQRVARGQDYRPPEILVLIGPTDCGKTTLAYTIPTKGGKVYDKPLDDHWFDGYDGESTILLDEFYGQLKFSLILKLLDGWPMRRQVKGSMVTLSNSRWVITSNTYPWQWYTFEGSKAALYNRLWTRFDSAVYDFYTKSFLTPPGHPDFVELLPPP